ncbi:P-loop containing nucleoside triphosphate hydrolase protein [Lyophyllum atratum]|nr:P-loop containing nucleoside triphosphate hydrolase protein [Lyophyllum atratum]
MRRVRRGECVQGTRWRMRSDVLKGSRPGFMSGSGSGSGSVATRDVVLASPRQALHLSSTTTARERAVDDGWGRELIVDDEEMGYLGLVRIIQIVHEECTCRAVGMGTCRVGDAWTTRRKVQCLSRTRKHHISSRDRPGPGPGPGHETWMTTLQDIGSHAPPRSLDAFPAPHAPHFVRNLPYRSAPCPPSPRSQVQSIAFLLAPPSTSFQGQMILVYNFEHTGVAYGLFPDDDKKLPRGWTRQNAVDVQSYFRAYSLLASEDKKVAFAVNDKGGSKYPGREFWNNWVNRRWDSWGVHTMIVGVLRDLEMHPLDIIVRDEDIDTWPSADHYIPAVIDPVALKLFGEEAFPKNSTAVKSDLRAAIRILVQRCWNTMRVQISTMKSRPIEIEAAAKAAFQGEYFILLILENGKPTKAKLSRAIHAVAKWKECSILFNTPENVEKAAAMLADLQEIMEGLGAKLDKRAQSKGTCKVSAVDLKDLATAEDVTDLVLMYHEYFERDVEDEGEPPLTKPPADRQALNDSGGDFGMEEESVMTYGMLTGSLGFRTGLPPQFNKLRDRFGSTPWEDAAPFECKHPPENIENQRLHWHQVAGTRSICRSVFTKVADPAHVPGMLIGDEVGLGKTAQTLTFIAFLMQAIWLQKNNKKLPKILVGPRIEGVLPAERRSRFLSTIAKPTPPNSGGPMVLCVVRLTTPHHIVIVASHSVLCKEMNDNHFPVKKRKDVRPWDMPTAKGSLTNTLFGQKYLTVTVDEAHHMRNMGRKHTAILRLLEQATIRLAMTATPLHTSSRDLSAMGRICCETPPRSPRQNIFLRRTTDSKDSEGNPLLTLPPFKEIIGVVWSSRKGKLISSNAELSLRRPQSSSASSLSTTRFYLEYRTAVGFAKEDPDSPWPSFKTLQEWAPVKSTKMEVCAEICKHYLSRDDVGDVTFANGVPVFPDIPANLAEKIRQNRRIIIYSEFSSMAPLLQNVLELHGVPSLTLNGKMSVEQRNKHVRDFYNDAHPARVLIFSSVGSAGLNLAIADVVIFFDFLSSKTPGSNRGPLKTYSRPGAGPSTTTEEKQSRSFTCWQVTRRILLMSNVAQGKRDMFHAFVNKKLAKGFHSRHP